MTYLECYNTIVEHLQSLPYVLHETYSQTLQRPCAVVEAHPGKSEVLNATGRMNSMEFVVTFMPVLDERNNIKDQRDMMAFVDAAMDLFRQGVPGMMIAVSPDGNAVTECYVKISVQFADTAIVIDEDEPLVEEIALMMQIEEE